jgi:predicted ribosome quality control (RQC) complex YloA/Tae2 family protein
MVTDHLLIRRAAAELDRALARSRVRDLGITDDGAFAIVAGGRGGSGQTLNVLPFASPPLIWLEARDELSLSPEPPWVRAAGRAVRGLQIAEVRARPGDRLIRVVLEARSRFGVADRYTLVLELVPRFGNIVLLKDNTVVTAAKTFSPAGEGRRVEIGEPYEEPPLGVRKAARIQVTPELEAAADGSGPVHVYHRGSELTAVHLLPLAEDEGLTHSTSARVLDVFRDAAEQIRRRGGVAQLDRSRQSLLHSLRSRQSAIASQLESLGSREDELARRDELRQSGELIYAYLTQIPAGASRFTPPEQPGIEIALDPELTPKENAARYFERYRKAAAAFTHLGKRRAALQRENAEIEQLLWEVERADASALQEIAADLRGKPAPRVARRITAVELPSGTRIYVGHSPRENVEITFRIGKPNDLWFHARNVPGAHVVLHAAGGGEVSNEDIATAAQLAAYHSRARASAAVDVDYAARKYVRKQRDGAAGMVWYTNAKTIRVSPSQAPEERRFK